MRIIRSHAFQRMPWKNGGGETVQIAIDDAARGLDDFIWRVSMARVESDGPFSLFPGIDRTLCILRGAGMTLAVAGREAVEFTQASAPFYFPADIPVEARLVAGGITDLNVMTRRGRARHFVSHIGRCTSTLLSAPGAIMMVLAWGGSCTLQNERTRMELADGDFAIAHAHDGKITASVTSHAYLVDLWVD